MYKNKIRNKKANLFDVVTISSTVIMVVFALFIVITVLSKFGDNAALVPSINDTGALVPFEDHTDKMVKGWDYGVLFLVILAPFLSYYLASLIPSDTKFYVFVFLLLGIIFICLMVLSNIYGAFMDSALFSEFISQTKYIPIIAPNLPIYGIIYTIFVLVGLFSKTD